MNPIIPAEVVGAERYNVDGNSGMTVFMLQDPDKDNPNSTGRPVTKMSAPAALFDNLSAIPLPAKLDLECTLVKGAGNSTKLKIVNFKPSDNKAK